MKNFYSAALILFFIFSPKVSARDIAGSVYVDGIPQERYVQVSRSEWKSCGMVKKVEDLIVGSGGELKDAVVWVDGEFSAAEIAVKKVSGVEFIDQKQCDFIPRVVTVPLGGRVLFRSSDEVRHGVAGFYPTGKNQFDLLLEHKGQTVETHFETAGPHFIRCGFHAWMGAVVYVTDHPFYVVTDKNGKFQITGLPTKDYRIKVWHERMGLTEAFLSASDEGSLKIVYTRPE